VSDEVLKDEQTPSDDESLQDFIKSRAEELAGSPSVDDESEDDAAVEAPAEDSAESAPAPEARQDFLDSRIPDDVDVENPWYRGRTVRDAIRSSEANYARWQEERAKQEEYRSKLAAYEAIDHYIKQARDARESTKPPEDPWAKRGINPEVDPIARPKEYSEAVVDIATERLRKDHEEQFRQYREETQKQAAQAEFERSAIGAVREAEAQLAANGVEPERFRKMLPWIMNDIYENGGKSDPTYLLSRDNYLHGWQRGRGFFAPETASAPPAQPAQSSTEGRVVVNKPGTPPGSKKPARSDTGSQKTGTGASVPSGVRRYIDQYTEILSQSGVPGFEDVDKAKEYMYERQAKRSDSR